MTYTPFEAISELEVEADEVMRSAAARLKEGEFERATIFENGGAERMVYSIGRNGDNLIYANFRPPPSSDKIEEFLAAIEVVDFHKRISSYKRHAIN